MIVADTNIISYLLLPTSYSNSVDTLYKKDSEWAAPILWKSEFRNVLALYLRKKIIDFGKALQLQDTAESIMAGNEFDISSAQVLALVEQTNCSSYDCEFVALAQHLNAPLVTQDKKVLQEFPSFAVSVSDFLARQANGSNQVLNSVQSHHGQTRLEFLFFSVIKRSEKRKRHGFGK